MTRVSSALTLSLLLTAGVMAQSQPASASAFPQSKTPIRRTTATRPQTKAPPPPSPVADPTPAGTPSTVPAPEAAAATPAATEVLEAAREEMPKPVKLDPVPSPEIRLRRRLNVVEQLVAQGLKQEALAELRSVAAEDRFDPQGFYNIANAFARLDATDEAISAYRKALEQRKGHYSRAANNLGVILLRQGFWDQAYDAFLLALRTENFHYAEASYNLGRLYAARGEMDRAFREWRRAVKVNPNHVAAAQALSGDPTPTMDRSISKSSTAASGKNGRVAAIRAANSSSNSSKSVPGMAASGKNARVPVPRDANSSSNSSKFVFTLDTETHEVLQRARSAHENSRYAEAAAGFKRVNARNGGYFAPATLELSYSLMELRRYDEAIAALLLVAEKDGARFPIAYYHLGRLYELRGDLPHAEENYLRATQAQENAQFLLNLSSVREKQGDFAGALVAMENYVKRMEQQGQKPEWSYARLKELRDKAAAGTSPSKPK